MSRYFAPTRPPPIAAVSVTPLYLFRRLTDDSTSPDDVKTITYTFTPASVMHPAARKVFVTGRRVNRIEGAYGYDCLPSGITIGCHVSYSIRLFRDGVDLAGIEPIDAAYYESGSGRVLGEVLDNAVGVSRTYLGREFMTPECSPCDPGTCPDGCTNYRWIDFGDVLEIDLEVFTGSVTPGDVVFHDVAPGQVYGIVSDFDPGNYYFLVNDEIKELYRWRTSYSDLTVAWLPKGFRIRAGDEIKLVVKDVPEQSDLYYYRITQFDWLVV